MTAFIIPPPKNCLSRALSMSFLSIFWRHDHSAVHASPKLKIMEPTKTFVPIPSLCFTKNQLACQDATLAIEVNGSPHLPKDFLQKGTNTPASSLEKISHSFSLWPGCPVVGSAGINGYCKINGFLHRPINGGWIDELGWHHPLILTTNFDRDIQVLVPCSSTTMQLDVDRFNFG